MKVWIILKEPEHPRICGKPLIVTSNKVKAYAKAKSYMLREDAREAKECEIERTFTNADRAMDPIKFCNKYISMWNTSAEIYSMNIQMEVEK